MKAVVLAAGFATRLHPLTRDCAKPLLDVAGRPVLSHLLDRILRVPGLDEVVVVANDRFHPDFVRWSEGERRAVPIRIVNDGARDVEGRLGGVADLALGLDALDVSEDGVLVAAGDNLVDFELAPFATEHRRRGRPLVLARTLAPPIPPRRFGEIEVDGDDVITRFREKPEDPRSLLAATCLYFFTPDVPPLVRRYLDEGGDRDAVGGFIQWLVARRRVNALPYEGICWDIGDLQSLEEARRHYRADP